MIQRTCDVDGCERKHVARGYCAYHWRIHHGERKVVEVTCPTCGEVSTKRDDGKATRRFCSLICRDVWRIETSNNPAPRRRVSRLPVDHPVRVLIRANATKRSPIREAYESEDWPALIDAIRDNCVAVDDCWLWSRGLKKKYPWVGIAGRTMQVHRLVAMAQRGGPLLPSEPVHHKCGEPMCVRPDHLQVVTAIENTAEMLERRHYQRRIAELESALAAIAPSHPALDARGRISAA